MKIRPTFKYNVVILISTYPEGRDHGLYSPAEIGA